MKTQFVKTLITAGLLLGTPAFAQNDPDMPPPEAGPHPGMMMPNIQKLNLTTEQKTKLQAVRKEKRAQTEALKKEIDAKRDAFHALMKSDANDADLKKSHEEMQALHQKMATLNFENLLAIRAILTPEQRKEMQAHMTERQGEMKQMHRQQRK